jgi:hypothetical protein
MTLENILRFRNESFGNLKIIGGKTYRAFLKRTGCARKSCLDTLSGY